MFSSSRLTLTSGMLAAGEADHQQPALRSERAQRVGEERHRRRRPPPCRRPAPPVSSLTAAQEAVDQDHLVGTGRAGDLGLLVGGDHGDGAGAVPLGDLEVAVPTPPAAPCTSTVSPCADLAALLRGRTARSGSSSASRRPARSSVSSGSGKTLSAPRPTVSAAPPCGRHAGDPVTGSEAGAVGGARGPRRRSRPRAVNGSSGLSWYSPLLSSRSGKRDPDRVHVDEHLRPERPVRGRLVDLVDLDGARSVEPGHLGSAHGRRYRTGRGLGVGALRWSAREHRPGLAGRHRAGLLLALALARPPDRRLRPRAPVLIAGRPRAGPARPWWRC